jgi:cell division protein FtsA
VAREEIAVGLDIGTTKVCTVVGHGDADGKLTVAGIGLVPSRGMRKGVVIDVEDTIAAVRESVERARHMAGFDFRSVAVGVTGDHIQSSNLRGTVTVASEDGIISASDVERVLQAAALDVPREREIIHSLPRYFGVDGQRGVRRPVGMRGRRLEVESHIVTGTASFLQNVVQCVEGANLKVDSLVLEPIATSEAVATGDERDLGVALIDIGGGTSDIAVFVEGSIAYSGVISVGGNHVTRDISIGLRTPFDIAERLKIERGVASPSLIAHGEALEVMTAGSGERLRLPRAVLGEIIEARMSELFEMARDMLGDARLLNRLPAGIVLTGGGALLPGALDLAGEIFQAPARLGKPQNVSGWSDQVDSPQFATAVGLLRFALRQNSQPGNLPLGALSASGPLPPANLTTSNPALPSSDFQRRAWGAPNAGESITEAPALAATLPVDAGLGPAPNSSAMSVEPQAQPATSNSLHDASQTPFDKVNITDSSAAENKQARIASGNHETGRQSSNESALDRARHERDRYFYEEEEHRTPQPPVTIWQKLLHKFREIIGFEAN